MMLNPYLETFLFFELHTTASKCVTISFHITITELFEEDT